MCTAQNLVYVRSDEEVSSDMITDGPDAQLMRMSQPMRHLKRLQSVRVLLLVLEVCFLSCGTFP